ncbi:MAG: class I SAM-dependent methyltransferase [Acidimicrobiia bacterium]|nr:class I SAM-dependent methyltransferase [Acidimicrobiia bacterium]
MTTPRYRTIVDHYEQCFETHGPGHLGVDWPNAEDADVRYAVMLGIASGPSSVLDFGCGSGGMLDYMQRQDPRFDNLDYRGHDLSSMYIEYCRRKYPEVVFTCGDVLDGFVLEPADFIVANGVFTEKLDLTQEEMLEFLWSMLSVLFDSARRGVAFNVMSTKVEWEREDLFHLEADLVRQFASDTLGASCQIVEDYGLYEYTVYLYRDQEQR